MVIVPKVGATAQLANTRGPAAHQLKAANDLANHICTQINDVFQRGENVSLNDLKEIIKPHAEGIDFDIIPLKKSSQRQGAGGRVNALTKKSTITRYSIELPSKKGNLRPYHMETIGHELTHFFTNIKLPKIMARNNTSSVTKPRENALLAGKLAISVPTTVIGCVLPLLGRNWGIVGASLTSLSVFLGKAIPELFIPTKAFEHYKKVLYNLSGTATKDPDKIKQLTKDALSQTKLNSNEKIDMLQSWRYGMINEQNAYKNGEEIDIGIDAVNGLFPLDKLLSNRVQEKYIFREKIAIVEDLLREEIAAHRQKHREKLRQKPPESSIKSLF